MILAPGLVVLLAQGPDLTIKAPPPPEPGSTTHLVVSDDPHLLPTLADVLTLAPGAVIRRTGGERATLQLRGAGGHQIKLLLDGVPLDDGRGAALDLAHLPMAAVERVEVRRGAAAAAHGSGAQGGVVHLHTTRRPTQRFRLQIGSFESRTADVALVERVGEGDLLAALGASTGAGNFAYLDANGQRRTRQNNAHGRLEGLLRLRVPLPTGGARLLLSGLSLGRGEPGLEQFEQADAHSHARQALAAVAGEVAGPGGSTLSAQAHGLERRFDFADPTPAFAGAARRFALRDTTRALRLGIETTPGTLQAALTLEGHHQAATTRTAGSGAATHRAEARLGGAITSNVLWNPGEGLHMQAVLRLDDTSTRDPLVVPALGLRLDLGHTTVAGHVGRLFRDPGFDELYFEAAGLRGNPDLHPEDGWGADLGVDVEYGDATVGLTGFVQHYDRLILYTPVTAWLIQPTDTHGARALGLELAGGAPLGPLQARLAGLLQTVALEEGPPLPFRPSHLLTADVRWPGPLTAFAAWQWQSEVTTDPFGHRTLPARHRLDGGVHFIEGAVTLAVEVRNVLNHQRNLDALQQPLPGRTLHLGLAWSP